MLSIQMMVKDLIMDRFGVDISMVIILELDLVFTIMEQDGKCGQQMEYVGDANPVAVMK